MVHQQVAVRFRMVQIGALFRMFAGREVLRKSSADCAVFVKDPRRPAVLMNQDLLCHQVSLQGVPCDNAAPLGI